MQIDNLIVLGGGGGETDHVPVRLFFLKLMPSLAVLKPFLYFFTPPSPNLACVRFLSSIRSGDEGVEVTEFTGVEGTCVENSRTFFFCTLSLSGWLGVAAAPTHSVHISVGACGKDVCRLCSSLSLHSGLQPTERCKNSWGRWSG